MEYRINLTDDTVEKLGEVLGEPIQELEQEILEKEEQVSDLVRTVSDLEEAVAELEDTVEEKQAIIDAFPTIEALSVTQNGTYNEEGKAYKPVTVNVPEGAKFVNITLNKGVNNAIKWAKSGVGISAGEMRFDNSSSGSYWQRLLDSYVQNTVLKIYAEAEIVASSTVPNLIVTQNYANNLLTVTLNTATLKSWYASHTINDSIVITIGAA